MGVCEEESGAGGRTGQDGREESRKQRARARRWGGGEGMGEGWKEARGNSKTTTIEDEKGGARGTVDERRRAGDRRGERRG
eukprot:2268040-Pleurochrysis_carterae.AAC.1